MWPASDRGLEMPRVFDSLSSEADQNDRGFGEATSGNVAGCISISKVRQGFITPSNIDRWISEEGSSIYS